MKFLSVLLLALCLSSCSTSKKSPEPAPKTPVIVAPTVPPSAVEIEKNLEEIKKIALDSKIAKYGWGNRGVTPNGYTKGMAILFARQVCNPSPATAKEAGSADKDALAYYGVSGSTLNTWALLYGLGPRESSGKYCAGVDESASNHASDTAEAGTFQTSFNAFGAHPEMMQLFNDYKAGKKKCYLEVFKEGVSCTAAKLKNYGSGNGLLYQKMSKECPAFHAEATAVGLRVIRKHWGPVNRKEAEFRNDTVQLLNDIQSYVVSHPEICPFL